jgi:MFS family permease
MAMLLAFVLAVLVQTNLAQFWHVLVIALALGIVGAVDFPAQSAFIGDLAGLSQVRKASALNASMIQLGRMLGPAFAGMLIAVAGLAPAFWINGLSFLAVIATLLIVRAEQVRRPSSGKPLGELAEAVRFVQGQPRIQDLLLCVFLLPMFVISATSLFPSLASDALLGGPETLGLLNAAGGAGALLGALFTAPQLARMPQVGTAVLGFVLWAGVWLALAGVATSLPLVLLCVALLSIALPTVIAGSNGLIQMLAPPQMRARLISLWIMVSFGAQPLGGLWGGFLAERFGVQTTLTVNGLILIGAAALIFLLRPEFRRWKVQTT